FLGNSLDSPPSSASSGFCSSCPNSKTYLCTAINKDTVHDHCKDGQACLGFDSSASCSVHTSSTPKCTPCPHPLMRFLTATSESPKDYPFGLPGITPMGFSNLSSTPVQGEKLYHDIYGFCKDGFYPLTRLVQFILCVSRHPPESLFDLYAFFKKFVEALNSKPELSSTFVQWIDGEPGTPDGQALKDAVQGLYGSHSGSSHSPANLFSLVDCHATKASGASCGPYLHALTEDVSGVFTPKLCSMYLSYVCYLAEKFYSEFQKFHKEAEKKFSSCCKSSCQKIVECPCALPFLYSQGFTFHSPSTLNCVDNEGKSKHVGQGGKKDHGKHEEGKDGCTTKSCSDFITQLKLVVNGHPFKTLIAEIEKFLWSIRLPFFLFVLAFWAFVMSYFLYVQLYKLDLLHLKSHAHLSRSFKILPSTLFSDASSKLKDLSYFSL
ncbi:variant erythrocyte surface antigen-1 family protein, partial [Babesia divergens]